MSAPRLAPLRRADWGDDARAALARGFSDDVAARLVADDAPPMPNVLGTLLHHPQLAGPFLAYNNVLLRTPSLDPRLRELAILRVAWRTHAPYEWAQHVRLAATVEITPAEIDAIGAALDDAAWSPLEAAALAAVDQCLERFSIDDATWNALAEELSSQQLVELVFVIGTYTGLAIAFNSFGLQLDADLQSSRVPLPPTPEE